MPTNSIMKCKHCRKKIVISDNIYFHIEHISGGSHYDSYNRLNSQCENGKDSAEGNSPNRHSQTDTKRSKRRSTKV